MMPVNSCLNAQQLQKLLNSTGNETELEPLTQHLGSCAECQVALQKVASGEIPVESLVVDNHAYRPEKDSAYWKAADMAKTFHQIRATSPPTQVTREVSTSLEGGTGLPFLEPPSDPAYIGRLDHFEIARVIGRGGMGIVLEAFDPHLQRSVAIKVLNPEYSKNTTARQRFCREGRAAAAISHEHVVPMYQVAKESDSKVAYLVMQLIDGDTLEDRLISRQPLPPGEVARIGMQIAAGLSAAHSRGMVHRDIKPANVMIERETNRVKLTDFGLARATDDVKLTKTGMVTGTPLYMSPEQATGAAADDRSDLFSFGAVLYEMATGESPFEAPSLVGVMKRVMDERPVPPQKLNPAIPTELSRIIMALLEKDPERRPESASAVAEQLAKIVTQFGPISPLHVPAVSASKSGRLSAASRRMPWLATSLSLIGIFSLLGAAGLLVWNRPWATSSGVSETNPFPSIVLAGNPGTVWSVDFVPGQDQIAAAVEDGSIRIWDIHSQTLVKSFNAHRGIIWMIQYHPNQAMMATSGDDGTVKLWDAEKYNVIHEWKADGTVKGISFSPDGERLIAGDRAGVLHVYDVATGETLMSKTLAGSIMGVDYSADGRLIAVVGSDKVVRVLDAETLEERQAMSGHKGPIYNVSFAPNSQHLTTVGWGKDVRVWDVNTGQQSIDLQGSQGDVWGVSYCHTGEHVVTSGQDGITRIWDLATGKEVASMGGHESAVHNLSLDPDPDGRRVATSGRDGTIRVWDLSALQK